MILTKYIFKDILRVQLVTFMVLLSVFLCQTVIKLLGKASSGSVPVDIVSELVLYSMPSVGFILIPMTLYVGIIVSLSRMSSDSEMVVMRSTGFSAVTFMKIALVLAFFSAIVSGINSLYFMPKANYEQKVLTKSTQNNPKYLPIESGKFTDFGDYTLYIQEVAGNGNDSKKLGQIFVIKNINNVLIAARETIFLSANSGHMHRDDNGINWLTLDNGTMAKSYGSDGAAQKTTFSSLSIPIPFDKDEKVEDNSLQSVSSLDLLKSDNHSAKVELQWRIAPIFACFILAIIAIPLSMINPRQGKFARLGPAIALFVCYYMFLLSVRNILNSERMPLIPGMYIVPIVFLFFIALPLNREKKLFRNRKKKS